MESSMHCVMLGLLSVDDRFGIKRGEGRGRQGKCTTDTHSAASSYSVVLDSVLHLAI